VDHDKHFHDGKSANVYDLYNACNGAQRNGALDIGKLDELSKEELDALDVPRLRDVWEHVASGCRECAGIIGRLNFARSVMSARASRNQPEPTPAAANAVNAEYAESTSRGSK
jgi:hypothetical protein